MTDRRRFLRHALALGALPAALTLSGCKSLIDVLGQACPEDPAESGGIDWTPDVMHPVFFGLKDYTTADGAPSTLRVFYPSYQTPFDGGARKILKSCLDRWPVVLFLHGQPACLGDMQYYLRWRRIPEMLARSGYVVVVPQYAQDLPGNDSPLIGFANSVIDWTRTSWEHAQWVDKRPEAVALVGHSFGALLSAQVARVRGNVGAVVALSGGWEEFHRVSLDAQVVLNAIGAPAFFQWARNVAFEDMDGHDAFDRIPGIKYALVHPGKHFDYLPSGQLCTAERGPCPWVERVSAELTALFLARVFPLVRSNTVIPVDLEPPTVTLTPKQQFYGGPDFTGLEAIRGSADCKSTELRWVVGAESDTRDLAA